ncbi:MAG: UDP-N-acetylmuramoyl-tripeptide--D-alanyl-D-alanine ligase [Parvularculaceae bacterium]
MTAGLWTAYEAAAATGGALCARGGDPERWIAEEWAAADVSIDTRSIKPGEMFVALRDARDGHEFIRNAFEAGAAAALVAKAPADAPDGAPLLVVPDTLEGLRDLARAARRRNFGKRVAVTGSVGKTGAKEMLRALLGTAGSVHAADKSFNNQWGVPLTLARMPMASDFGVFEIGMNHAGEITPLARLVKPHAAIVTTIAPAHLEFFSSVEDIAEAKAEIFLGLNSGGTAVLPFDNPHYSLLERRAKAAGAARILSFGEGAGADFRLTERRPADADAAIFATFRGEKVEYRLGAPGAHQALNSLAALAAAYAVDVDPVDAAASLAGLAPTEGRGARTKIALKDGGEALLIDESYNANPASMTAALALLGAAVPARGGRRIAVLGEMLELGETAEALHAGLSEALVASRADRLYVAGALMNALWDAAPAAMRAARAPSASGLLDAVMADLRDGDVIMVKGSNASKVSEIARALKERARQDD